MKKEELMIGDWVKLKTEDGTFSKVEVFHLLQMSMRGFIDGDKELNEISYDDVEPIQLNSEILEKNGFHPLYDDLSAYKLFWSDEKEENYWSITIDLTHPLASRIEKHIMRTGKKGESWEMKGCVYFVNELQHLIRQFKIEMVIEI